MELWAGCCLKNVLSYTNLESMTKNNGNFHTLRGICKKMGGGGRPPCPPLSVHPWIYHIPS